MRGRPLDLEKQLNPEQIAAVTHGEGPQLVLAGAGSGKTRVITHRIAWLADERGVDPSQIVAMTFTNKAAGEMKERVGDLLGMHPLPTFVGTFHRYALILLRRYGERVNLRRDFSILDTQDQQSLIKQALGTEGLSEKAFAPRAVLAEISSAKNRLLDPAGYEKTAENFFQRKVAQLYRRYQGLLQQAGGVDFDDMISLSVRLLTREEEVRQKVRARTRYLLVDEYQDTNHAQLRLVQELIGENGNLTAVGDEDQGIYRWRGADIDNILEFEKTFPGAAIRKLERNYRSTQTILDVSGALVAHNVHRRGKKLWTESGPGAKVELYKASDEIDEARWTVGKLQKLREQMRWQDLAVLVRTNAQTRAIEEELLKREIPYTLVGGTRFYERTEIKDLVAYLKVLRNPHDSLSLARIFNQPPRGLGKTTQAMLEQRSAELGQPFWNVIALDDLGSLPARSATAVGKFRDLIRGLQKAAAELPLPALLDRLLAATGYLDLYGRGDDEDKARLENIQEFLSAAQEFTEANSYNATTDEDLMTAFLDHVSLVADLDGWEGEKGVSLMTLHSAKGLEFRAVVVSGLEDGLLPHFNSQGARENLEEERRLLYVGMTRAKERLYLTSCRRRRIAGRYQDQLESAFLGELPEELLIVTRSPELAGYERFSPQFSQQNAGIYSFFGQAPASGGTTASAAPEPRSASPQNPEQRRSTEGYGRPASPSYVSNQPAHRPASPARPAAPSSSGYRERTLEPDPDTLPRRPVKRGSRVRHPTLGQGVVLEMDGLGDDAKITVFFDKAGKRKLVAKFANLEML
ncbi:MAG: UvrD-helicase domain-containing protein [Acidobacteriota bacterium]